jgi:hypothetical protein
MPKALFLFLITGVCSAAIDFPHNRAACIVSAPASPLEKRVTEWLSAYVEAVTRIHPKIVATVGQASGQPVIVLAKSPAGHPEAFTIRTDRSGSNPRITLSGSTDRGLKRAVQKLILMSRQMTDRLQFPDMNLSETPWIAEREWTVCPWVPQHVRGAFVNPFADNRMNIWNYGDRQFADYVAMYDAFGYSGVQLMETSYSYSVFGSPEAFQSRQRELAKNARENGQNVSLWVWAAEFSGHGWIDPGVTYEPSGKRSAFDDPDVRRSFEKYYNLYAGLAPCVDRLIGHFYDPGRLTNRQDVFRYMRLLEQKFKAKNPKVRMAIDSWGVSHDYLRDLIANGFTDYELLEMSMPSLFKPGQRESFHEEAKRLGLKLGVWGWYTTEYESDQIVSMYVNARLLQNFYRQMREGALKIHPVAYWSEMEAHHLNNIYSMYAAAQLLWNPDRDPDEILAELTDGIWGPVNGPQVLQALQLVQDVRSGPSWETYWWTLPGYRPETRPPVQDLARAETAISTLERMKTDPAFVPKFPLPFPPAIFIRLMLPHLRQIREFARFRIDMTELKRAMTQGLSKEEAARRLTAIWKPIPDYDTWIGTFGQPEERLQSIMIRKLAEDAGLKVEEPAWLRARDAGRLLEKLQLMQRAQRDELVLGPRQMNEFYWPPPRLQSRLEHLLNDGSIEKVGNDKYRLANWSAFAAPPSPN